MSDGISKVLAGSQIEDPCVRASKFPKMTSWRLLLLSPVPGQDWLGEKWAAWAFSKLCYFYSSLPWLRGETLRTWPFISIHGIYSWCSARSSKSWLGDSEFKKPKVNEACFYDGKLCVQGQNALPAMSTLYNSLLFTDHNKPSQAGGALQCTIYMLCVYSSVCL